MLCGTLCYFFLWSYLVAPLTGKDWAWVISAGLTPFIVGEVLKIAIADYHFLSCGDSYTVSAVK